MTAYAAFSKESRMRFANANQLHRKSGGANSGFPTTPLSETTTYAAFFEESRMIFTETTKSDRKSGGSREPALSEVEGDLQFFFP
jgi:hypothetical protein